VQRAYLSHCPNRFPDFQQLIELDEVPEPYKGRENKEKSVLYQVSPSLHALTVLHTVFIPLLYTVLY
jgi:hypothetical protein